ncbi:hypothetical protein AB0I76_27715, partial [Micromonospora sp. NPDC049799]
GRRAPSPSAGLSPRWGTTAAALLLVAVGWFVVELVTGGPRIGLAERVAAGAEALCPLVVALTAGGRAAGFPTARRVVRVDQ